MSSFDFEPSGKIKWPSQEELLKADQAGEWVLAFSDGMMADGRPYWAYIAVKPSLYGKFYALSAARQSLVLNEYGEVLAIGNEVEPPPEIIREMQDKFGADHAYKDKLFAEAKREQDMFVKKREDKRIADIVTMLKKKQG